MEETIGWAVAAFTSNKDLDDDAIASLLDKHGVPAALASRCVLMLPLAFGRKLLRGMVEPPDEIYEGDKLAKLSADPVFAAAAKRAEAATREQIEAIALRSAEVNAVNAALNAGSKPADLMMSAPRTGASTEVEPDPAWAQRALGKLTSAHDSKLAWEVRVFPSELVAGKAQLQVDVVVDGIMESFAGLGTDIPSATLDAMGKFARASLHVLLATLEGKVTEQVTFETWGPFKACLGPLLRQWSKDTPVDFAAYVDALKAKLVELPRARHWFRTFVAVGPTEIFGFDALLDNNAWEPAVELVKTWPWPRGESAYALRHFVVLTPNDG